MLPFSMFPVWKDFPHKHLQFTMLQISHPFHAFPDTLKNSYLFICLPTHRGKIRLNSQILMSKIFSKWMRSAYKQLYFNPWKPVVENDSTLFTALLSISTCVFHCVMQHYGTCVIYSVNKHGFNGVH